MNFPAMEGAAGSGNSALCCPENDWKRPARCFFERREGIVFTLKNHIRGKVYDLTQENMSAMLEAIDDIRGALEWYEDRNNYCHQTLKSGLESTPIIFDAGERARKALGRE